MLAHHRRQKRQQHMHLMLSCPWMRGQICLDEVLRAYMRVDLRGGDTRVTQQFLHGAHVGPALDQMRGEGMAQCVRMQGLVDMRAFPGRTDDLPHRLP